jgi:hypothetical protein
VGKLLDAALGSAFPAHVRKLDLVKTECGLVFSVCAGENVSFLPELFDSIGSRGACPRAMQDLREIRAIQKEWPGSRIAGEEGVEDGSRQYMPERIDSSDRIFPALVTNPGQQVRQNPRRARGNISSHKSHALSTQDLLV